MSYIWQFDQSHWSAYVCQFSKELLCWSIPFRQHDLVIEIVAGNWWCFVLAPFFEMKLMIYVLCFDVKLLDIWLCDLLRDELMVLVLWCIEMKLIALVQKCVLMNYGECINDSHNICFIIPDSVLIKWLDIIFGTCVISLCFMVLLSVSINFFCLDTKRINIITVEFILEWYIMYTPQHTNKFTNATNLCVYTQAKEMKHAHTTTHQY